MKQMRVFHGSWTVISVIAASVALTGCNNRSPVNQVETPTSGQDAGTFKPTKIVQTDKPPVVTLDEYNKLKTGLSYNAAVKIIGAPGRKSLRRWPDAPHKVMYLWNNADNSNMYAVFDHGKLTEKTQFGLS